MTLEDTANLKKALLEEKVIGEEDNVFLELAEEPCSYARNGYLWSTCRVICKDGEYVLLDFYICD